MTGPGEGPGPSSDAWGKTLTAPQLVSHQGLLLAFAREVGCATTVLYFQVLAPGQPSSDAAELPWNGWYRFALPGAPAEQPTGADWQREQPVAELRLAGMDLLTVTPAATSITPADASFQITSDGQYLVLARPSKTGSVYLNRLMVQSWTEEAGGVEYARYGLEVAWEVRYQRSGVRDVPLGDTDSLSSLDLTGAPFFEPTIELNRVAGATDGAFAITRVGTADPATVRWYVACSAPSGVRLFRITQTDDTVTDFTESTEVYPTLQPTCDGHSLPPVAGLAPALVMYAEQDSAPNPSGTPVEVQRAARLMLAIPVSGAALGQGLDRATVVYDFGLDQAGLIPPLDSALQPVVLVDGTIVGGAFKPDLSSPGFPTPAQAPQVSHVVDGLVVTGLLLGQLQPHTDLSARMAEDGLVHLYCGGPLATVEQALTGWRALIPGQPQAMVAQFDPRVSRVVITVPWAYAAPTEQGPGQVQFVARQAGPVMTGSTIAVSDAQFGTAPNAQPQPDLCDVTIRYPAATGLGSETWRGVPREVAAFATVLDGGATDDSADPAVLDGSRPFFDFAGQLPQARLPIPPVGPLVGFAPVATVVSARTSIVLAQLTVARTGSDTELNMAFQSGAGLPIAVVWPGLPTVLDGWADILGGSAATGVYPYTPGSGTSYLYGLATDAVGVDAPVLFHPASEWAVANALKVQVSSAAGGLTVKFTGGERPITIENVPSAVDKFAEMVSSDPGFKGLGLAIDIDGVAGHVLPTSGPVGPMDLRSICALFDLLLPDDDITGCSVPAGRYQAGVQQHLPATGPAGELTRIAGFACVPELPDAGIPAYLRNQAAELTQAGVHRRLHARPAAEPAVAGAVAAEPAVAGLWLRQTPPLACSFTGTDSVSIPVVAAGAALPASENLRPQWDWTLEAWVQPSTSVTQRLVTFHDAVTKQPATAPALDYRIALEGQDVVTFSSYAKKPGLPDSSYFQTYTSPAAQFLRGRAFSWECWIQPQSPAGPAGGLGGIIAVQVPQQPAVAFSIMVDSSRRIVLRISPDGSSTVELTGTASVPSVGAGGMPVWTHVAVVGSQQRDGSWTLLLYLNARLDSTFSEVSLQQDMVGAFLVIGANTVDDASMFGKLAALRFWAEARTAVEIRRTAFASLSGTEAGLLGCWPMTELHPGGPTGSYLVNTAKLTGPDWDAPYYSYQQPVTVVADDYFLSLVAAVAGLPPVEAHAVLPNDRWNHIAVVFQGGGALRLNPPARFSVGAYDWARVPGDNLNPSSVFAVDAWIQLPAAPAQNATILSHWAWDAAPDDRCFQLAVDPAGNLVLTVQLIDTDQGAKKMDSLVSSGINLADGQIRHVAAVFLGTAATNQAGSTASYSMTLYADGKVIASKPKGTVATSTIQLCTSQTDVLIGRTNVAPAGAEQPVESLGLFCGTLGQLRFWSSAPSVADLFPETAPRQPRFGNPPGLAATWAFRDQQGVLATDSTGGNDAILTSSAPWSSLRATSTLRFVANGIPVSSVVPYTGMLGLTGAGVSQFTFGAPVEAGIAGLDGNLGQVSLWGVARDVATIRGQQFSPLTGDEAGLLACWDFSDGGVDLTGGGNNPSPPIAASRITPTDLPVTNEGALVRNVYGGTITDLSASTPGRIAVGSYAEARAVGTRTAQAVLRRQYLLDPNSSLDRPIDVGLLDLIYVGQVQTDPKLIGYIEGAPPVPSENLSRPYYLSQSGAGYTAYTGSSSVTLNQQSSSKVAYSSSTTTVTDVDFKAALGIFGINSRADWNIVLMNKSAYDLKATVQAVAAAKATYGSTEGTDLSGEWTATQRDTFALKGDWEPFQPDPAKYLNPQVGRRFQPANLGYALVESLTADLFAMVYHSTGAAVGTLIVPNPAIPPDRNLLLFPMNDRYTKNGTLDGKVGLVNDPSWPEADLRRGSYFRPAEAYALAAAIEAQNQRRQAYAAQFDWRGRGHGGEASLTDAAPNLPVDFESEPASGNQVAVPQTGIANRYVWSADKGLHVESQGFASVSSRSYTGWRNRGGGGGLKAQGEFFFYLGFAYSLDLLVTHMVDVHVGLKTDNSQNVSLDATADGESYLPAWDPNAPAVYGGGKGAFRPGLGPGKVRQYRFFSFLLPASQENAARFAGIVDPVWRKLSNDPTARALRELSTDNPVWRVLHRVTYVERVPPPLATRPVFSTGTPAVEPANLAGNVGLLTMITGQVGSPHPTSAQVGAAVATVLNPAPTSPGNYPPALLERTVPWWRGFLDLARPTAGGPPPSPEAAALLTLLVSRVVRYVVAGYRTSVLPLPSGSQPAVR